MRPRLFAGAAMLLAFALWIAEWPLRPTQIPLHDARALDVFDRYGERLGTLYSRDEEHSAAVSLAQMSPWFQSALVAAEDHRFFEHGAVDGASLLRAVAATVVQRRPLGGASTISMQLARLLTPVFPGIRGKFEEAFIAARLESGLTKAQILEAYANRIPMGSNLYGVQAAARTYFGVDARDLDLAQATLLAALPNDPVRLDPYAHWNALKARQAYILARMQALGLINDEQRQRAAAERVLLQAPQDGIVAAPHFLFWLAPRVPPQVTEVRTTIDLRLQRFVQGQVRAVVQALGTHAVHDAAAIVIDNRSAQILAYVGSPDYFDDTILGRNDGVQALRQPGSALKPFLYELALEQRTIRPATILQDVPTAYALPGARVYAPHDYSNHFTGPVRVRIALADSLNVPAVRVLERVGVLPFLQRLHELGFAHLSRPADYYGLGLTLGGGEVSLYELARAYTEAARGGTPVGLQTTIADDAVSGAPPPAQDNVPDGASWALVTDILADRYARAAAFGVNSVLALPFAAAVKTGTSSDYRDTWTVGFTRDYTVAVWVGNFDGSPMRGISGVTGAGPLWNRIMLHLHESRDPPDFDPPRGYVRRPICADTGMKPDTACRAVVHEYLDAGDLLAYERVRSAQTRRETSGMHVLFPRDGDRFVWYPAGAAQRLQFVFGAPLGRLEVTLNGRPLAPIEGDYLWPLALGSYRLRAVAENGDAAVRFTVVRPPAHRAGFSLRGR
jgi:penicillin-binding protein 1C